MNNKQPESLIHTGDDLFRLIERDDRDAFTDFYSTYFKKLMLVSDRMTEKYFYLMDGANKVRIQISPSPLPLRYFASITYGSYRNLSNPSSFFNADFIYDVTMDSVIGNAITN